MYTAVFIFIVVCFIVNMIFGKGSPEEDDFLEPKTDYGCGSSRSVSSGDGIHENPNWE